MVGLGNGAAGGAAGGMVDIGASFVGGNVFGSTIHPNSYLQQAVGSVVQGILTGSTAVLGSSWAQRQVRHEAR